MWDGFIISEMNMFSANVPPACFKSRMRRHWEFVFQNRLVKKPIKVFSCLVSFSSDLLFPSSTTEKTISHEQIKDCSVCPEQALLSLPLLPDCGKDLDFWVIQSYCGSSTDKWRMMPEHRQIFWKPQQCCKYILFRWSTLPREGIGPAAISFMPRDNLRRSLGSAVCEFCVSWRILLSTGKGCARLCLIN